MIQCRVCRSAVFTVLVFCAATVHAATLQLMLHPQAAAGATASQFQRLGDLTGYELWPQSITRTGAYEFDLPGLTQSQAGDLLVQLRQDSAVLWAEIAAPAAVAVAKKSKSALAGGGLTQQLIARVRDDQLSAIANADDRAKLIQGWATLLGTGLTLGRELEGGAWLLDLDQPLPVRVVAAFAEQLEQDPAVLYADPVTQLRPLAVPNDPLFGFQWNLTNAVSGINAPAAWDITTGTGIVVGVIDTGILPLHPDLAGKVLPGFDMISDPTIANDGDGRDSDTFDSGDWLEGHDCDSPDPIFEQSSWHGSHVAGIIAANANNGQGIAGINWGARILPVRTLGKCGGTNFDVADSILWAVGVPVAGAPINPSPAQVLNLSLGGEGACPGYVQQAIDAALARGVAVVVAAGNSAEDVAAFSPANCNGVITVAAHNIGGDRAFYSNFGPQIEISAPGGEFWSTQGVLSTISSGPRTALDYNYAEFEGTSMAAPHVTGVASLMLSKNPNLTPGQILTVLQQSARPFPGGSSCTSQLPDPTQPTANLAHVYCGAGMVDAAAALARTPAPTLAAVVSGTVTVTELFNTVINRFFLTANPAEVQVLLQAGAASGWQLTGQTFRAYVSGTTVPSGTVPVCRFYSLGVVGSNSHFYTADPGECALVGRIPGWIYEGLVFNATPAQNGACPSGTVPLFRLFNGGAAGTGDHRFTTKVSIFFQMLGLGWLDEGVAMCLPQ